MIFGTFFPSAVFRRLADGFAAGLPDYAVGKTSLAILPGGLLSCRTRSAGSLLRDALQEMMEAYRQQGKEIPLGGDLLEQVLVEA